MNIGILSDIHIDLEHPEPNRVIEGLVNVIEQSGVAIMIIAGDIANDYERTLHTLHLIEELTEIRCLFVPGNHDIWNEKHPDKTSWEIYEALKAFSGNLVNGPVALPNGWTVIGDIGWYDYSFGSSQYPIEQFDQMKIDDRVWQDKIKTDWGKSTIEMHRYFFGKLETQLSAHRSRKIILVTHVLPLSDFTVQLPNRMWRYLNAFLGSKQYGELALKYSVAYSISGHVHYRLQQQCQKTVFICNCLNYASQWIENDDPVSEVARAFKTIEI
ncbi:MAG TPA: metallophosphoesterase [Desulfobacterales bacterium]|nr:metallophosphoesterase [Desulfobacterales bacterium]